MLHALCAVRDVLGLCAMRSLSSVVHRYGTRDGCGLLIVALSADSRASERGGWVRFVQGK